MDAKALPALNAAVDKLTARLMAKTEELRLAEARSGRGWNPRKLNHLRDEISSLEERLARAERLQERALSGGGLEA